MHLQSGGEDQAREQERIGQLVAGNLIIMAKQKQLSHSAFLKRVHDAIKHYDMLQRGDKVLVAVSGGSDSVCLIESLLFLKKKLGIDMVVANMDHGLRGKESREDSNFVKALAKKLKVKCVHKKINLKKSRKKNISVEELAREKRYAFLFKEAKDNKCNIIATGHNMNDQAETVLMKIISGSSIRGITGIPPVRGAEGVKIIRPLIRTDKTDILNFLKKNGSDHVEDSTNLDKRFLRNRVRLEVLPFLEKCNPRLKRTLVNLSDTLREDLVFIDGVKGAAPLDHDAGSLQVDIKDIILQPKTLRKELFKELFRRAGGNVKKLTYRHWMDMDRFLKSAEKGKSLDLPGSVRVTKRGNEIVFGKSS
ncbi:MAG: tRNA lysidine(34) synthetase TilS [Candidatus Omnitrophica bacterium]|nr:tRNA lysidine(34) synthetase TilS [Candidatus Omnitrophota bacterium]